MSAAPHAIPAAKWDNIPPRVIERVRDRVAMGQGGCWISTYSVANHGYAQVGWHDDNGRWVTLCHRVIWIAHHGPIAAGMTVDHLCKTRRCVRPDHLRLIENLENARRTSGRDWEIGKCVNGHDDAENWRPAGPDRAKGYCAACRAEANAAAKNRDIEAWRVAKRAACARYRARRNCRRTSTGDDR